MAEKFKENIEAALEEIDACIDHFSMRRPYHGDDKYSSDWHDGWENAAAQGVETLNLVQEWLRSALACPPEIKLCSFCDQFQDIEFFVGDRCYYCEWDN